MGRLASQFVLGTLSLPPRRWDYSQSLCQPGLYVGARDLKSRLQAYDPVSQHPPAPGPGSFCHLLFFVIFYKLNPRKVQYSNRIATKGYTAIKSRKEDLNSDQASILFSTV